jgi:osmotically inducible protein OsmC
MKHMAVAQWNGTAREGKGSVTTASRVLLNVAYRNGRNVRGRKITSGAELIAAAHAACFSVSLAEELGEAGLTAQWIKTTATVTSRRLAERWTVTGIVLKVVAKVPTANAQDLIRAALAAKLTCTICRILNVNTSLQAKLERAPNRFPPKSK